MVLLVGMLTFLGCLSLIMKILFRCLAAIILVVLSFYGCLFPFPSFSSIHFLQILIVNLSSQENILISEYLSFLSKTFLAQSLTLLLLLDQEISAFCWIGNWCNSTVQKYDWSFSLQIFHWGLSKDWRQQKRHRKLDTFLLLPQVHRFFFQRSFQDQNILRKANLP